MPQVKALRTFQSRYGYIRAGSRFAAEPGYAVELTRNGLIEILKDDENEPARIQAFIGAPSVKNSDPPVTSAGQRVAGGGQPSLSSHPVLPSQLKTPPPSKPPANAKRS